MARRVTSRTLIGRAEQVATLQDAVTDAAGGRSRIVLITGDAGIGKTRLVDELAERARAVGALVAVGGCVQLGEVSVAFAPLVEALRDLRRQLGEAELDELLGSGRAHLLALLTGAVETAAPTGVLFEHLLGLLTRLGRRHPVVLVFEDLHWADASTRDLVTYLGRNLRSAPVVLVLTLRADELHRRHPLRPVVAALERGEEVERLDITGLDRDGIARLLAEIGRPDADDALVADLHARSGGNPFFVEELVASGRLTGGLSGTLAEVILARLEGVPEEVRRLLRAAAVVDEHVDDELLATVTGQPITEVTAALRRAVEEQVLVLDTATCRFRHALVREALYDDLLPGERARLHVATATALEAADHLPPHTRWAMVAYHWDAGRDAARAYAASVRAGIEAEHVHAYSDAAAQFERALGLRDQVVDPDALGGLSLAELLLHAADAVQAGSRSGRAVVLAEAALAELDAGAPPERRALVLERIALANWTQHQGAAAVAAYERAAALVADRPASRDKAFVLAALGRSLMVRALYSEAIPVLRRAIAVAGDVSAADVEAHARCSLGPALHGVGRVADAFTEIERSRALARATNRPEDLTRYYTNLTHCLYQGARFEEVPAVAREGLDFVVAAGYAHHHGEAIAGNCIAALHAAGRWAEAEAIHDDPRIPTGDPYQELRYLPLLLDSGRWDEARTGIRAALEGSADADDVQFGALSLLLAARLRVLDAAWDEARQLVGQALPLIERSEEHFYLSKACALGLSIERERLDAAGSRHEGVEVMQSCAVADDLLARLERLARERAGRGVALLPEAAGWLVTGRAEHARIHGRDDPADWAAAAQGWRDAGQPLLRARAELAQVDLLARRGGRRDEVAELLRAAYETAHHVGARPLQAEIRSLARRARVDLDGGVAQLGGVVALRVTPRELDVLKLVAQGRTNRQIGEALFISEKTASVHVTNLLRKLGVGSRVEAAAVAVRTGVADQPE